MANTEKPSAIIIDDMDSMRNMAKVMLAATGCHCIGESENGQLGIKLYQDLHPDLVLLDIEMPVRDGISTLKAILKINPDTIVVMMTTVSNVAVAETCMYSGAKDYIQKDTDPGEIKRRLEEIVKKFFPR